MNDAVRERSGPGAADSLLMTAFVCHVGAHLDDEDSGRLAISLMGVGVHAFIFASRSFFSATPRA